MYGLILLKTALEAYFRILKNRKQRKFIFIVFLVYFIIIAFFLILQAIQDYYKNQSSQQMPSPEVKQLILLQSDLKTLDLRIRKIEQTIQGASLSAHFTMNDFNDRLTKLEEQQEKLSNTVLDNDKVLTAQLLREDQTNLEKNFIDLKNSQKDLSQKVDTYTLGLFAIPVVTFVFTLVGGFVAFLYSYIKKGKDQNKSSR